MRLFYTDERPSTGWEFVKQADGTWKAEQLGGPRAITANNINGLLTQIGSDEDALRRRFTEAQIRQAATAVACDPDALAGQLRTMAA